MIEEKSCFFRGLCALKTRSHHQNDVYIARLKFSGDKTSEHDEPLQKTRRDGKAVQFLQTFE